MDISPPLFLGQEPHPGEATFIEFFTLTTYQITGIASIKSHHHICENGKSFRDVGLTQ